MALSDTHRPSLWGLTEDLDYFLALQEAQSADKPAPSPQMWDRRADAWERERAQSEKSASRVCSTLAFLDDRGLLQPQYDVADIGCGPGRFAVAFARRVHHVAGFDLSPKMVQYGMEYAQREGVDNVCLRACDFQTLDIQKEGLEGAFDLVFSSLTPAVQGETALRKAMAMSRAHCCSITHIYHHNSLRRQLQTELFGLPAASPWGGRRFYALFNTLLLWGYLPETSYDHQQQERKIYPSTDYADIMMEQILPVDQRTTENQARILAWMEAHVGADGTLTETIRACYGRILWNVRVRSDLP